MDGSCDREMLLQWKPDTTILDITISPVKRYSKMYGTDPRYNDLQYNDIPDITLSFKSKI